MKISIKIKFTAFLIVLLISTICFVGFFVLNGISTNQTKDQEAHLIKQTEAANLYVYQIFVSGNYNNAEVFLLSNGTLLASKLSELAAMPVELYTKDKKKIGDSTFSETTLSNSELLNYASIGKTAYKRSQSSLDFFAPLSFSSGQLGIIHFNYSLKDSNAFYNKIKILLYSLGSLVFLLSFSTAYFYFGSSAKAITKLNHQVSSIRDGNYNSLQKLERRDELGDLSQGINFMSAHIKNDIETLKEREQKLQSAIDKLTKLEKTQKEFIGNITHEFKTPLTIIRACVDLIDMYGDDLAMTKKAKENISIEVDRLHEMVEKSIELSKIEKYEFKQEPEIIELSDLIESVINRLKGKAEKFDVNIYYDANHCLIQADEDSLTHVFINLLDNAIKYNKPSGKIVVRNYKKEDAAYIEFQDTGIGIPLEQKDSIFQPFYRVNKEFSRQTGGTGLGLSLVKTILEKQKGSITLKESSPTGSTFLVSLKTSVE